MLIEFSIVTLFLFLFFLNGNTILFKANQHKRHTEKLQEETKQKKEKEITNTQSQNSKV